MSSLLDDFHQALAARSGFEAVWQEVAEFVHPTRSDFNSTGQQQRPTERRRLFDSTALLAAEALASGLFGALTNPASPWFKLEGEDSQWTEAVEQKIDATFNAGGQAFYTVLPDLFRDLVCFGTAILAVKPGGRFQVRNLRDFVLEADGEGCINRTYRSFSLSASAALTRFGPNTPTSLRDAASKNQRQVARFVEITEMLEPKSDSLLLPSCRVSIIELETGRTLETNLRAHPTDIVLRWSTAGGGPYGDSPAMLALPDIKTLNAMCKASLLAAQKAVDPPVLSAHEQGMRGLKTHPGAVIYGGLDASGRRLYQPFMDGSNPGLSLEMEEQRRAQIRGAFFSSLLMAAQMPGETATAFLGRQEEKARLLAPYIARLQSEFLNPLVQRIFGQLYRAGALPPTQHSSLAITSPTVRLISPLAQAQRMTEAGRNLKILESVSALSGMGVEPGAIVDMDRAAHDILTQAGLPNSYFAERASS